MWHYSFNGTAHGPITGDALIERVRRGAIPATALVWCAGMKTWEPLVARFPQDGPHPEATPAAPALSLEFPEPPVPPIDTRRASHGWRVWAAHGLALGLVAGVAAAQGPLIDRILDGDAPVSWLNVWLAAQAGLTLGFLLLAVGLVRWTQHAGHRFVAVALYGLGGLGLGIWTFSLVPAYRIVAHRMETIGTYTMSVSADGQRLSIVGMIGAGFHQALSSQLDAHPEIRRLVVTSPGGLTQQADQAAALIQSRALDVEIRGQCASACVTLLMAGNHRFATIGTIVGLHSVKAFDGLRPMFRNAVESGFHDYYDFLAARGLPDRYLKMARETPAESMREVDAVALAGDGVLSVLIDDRVVTTPVAQWAAVVHALGGVDDANSRALVRILRALAASRPKLVEQQAASLYSAMLGESSEDAQEAGRQVVVGVLPEAIDSADAASLTAFLEVRWRITEFLAARNTHGCAQFAYQGRSLSETGLLTPDLLRQVLESMARVIESAGQRRWAKVPISTAARQSFDAVTRRAALTVLAADETSANLDSDERAQCRVALAVTRSLHDLPGVAGGEAFRVLWKG